MTKSRDASKIKLLAQSMYLCLILILCAFYVKAEIVAVSQLGYHPNAPKQVVVYTNANSGIFKIRNAATNSIIAILNLSKPRDFDGNIINCQGNQSCLVGKFSDFNTEGSYYISIWNSQRSPKFNISKDIFKKTVPLFIEFFNANQQQNSGYHADWNVGYKPPFTHMADGSIINEADMTALPLIRMGSAYRRDPSLFSSDKYNLGVAGVADFKEYINSYSKYLLGLQINAPFLKDYSVSRGWGYNFACWPAVDPSQPRFINGQDPCMTFYPDSNSGYTAMALLAYLEAIPAVYNYSKNDAVTLLNRSINTYNFIRNNYGTLNGGDAGFVGASLFILYDYTGNKAYMKEAYNLRTSISTSLSSDKVAGNEFYWEEYARHKQQIIREGLVYPYAGTSPEEIFRGKIIYDYKDAPNPISKNGERIFQFNNNVQFQNSRFILNEGIIAAKATELNPGSESFMPLVATNQLYWMTGMNAVQYDSAVDSQIKSVSFIFGIGNYPKSFHTRLLSMDEAGTTPFMNGMLYIPGWIDGAYDTTDDPDSIFNFQDRDMAWQYTESTNEMVASAIELYSYLDAQYNNRSKAPPISFEGIFNTNITSNNATNNTTQNQSNTCFGNLQQIPASCDGGVIIQDIFNGCRTIICSNNSNLMNILACDKPTGNNPLYFEMYRQSATGTIAKICIGNTCILDEGYKKSEAYPICLSGNSTGPATNSTNSTNNCSPTPEICDGKDNNCNGMIDENNVCSDSNSSVSVSLNIAPWYPKGKDYIFVCNATGYAPDFYDWFFGDGEKQLNSANKDVYYTYKSAGNYNVACTAKNPNVINSANLSITVA